MSLPAFSSPPPPQNFPPSVSEPSKPLQSPLPEEQDDSLPTQSPVVKGDSGWARETPTESFSTGSKIDVETVTLTVAAILGVGLVALDWALRRSGRKLRQPTEDQLNEIAEPTGKLALRYTPLDRAPESLVDIAALAKGISRYVKDGPIVEPLHEVEHVGMPDNTEQDQTASADAVTYLT